MKKIIAVLMTLAMILSLGAVMASALTVEEIGNITFAAGKYGTTAEDFSSLGTVKIDWDPDAATKLNVKDGDMADWAAAGYNTISLTANNMVSWVGDATTAPAGWSISTYFVADSDNLYIGFYVTDPNFAYGDGSGYNGDAFQVCIDFGGKMGDQIEEDPDVLTNPKNIFYSFSCAADGEPLMIMRQESDQDGWLTEDDGVFGAASKTADGWCAEFSMSFDRLFEDYAWKAWDEDAKIYVGSEENLPLKVGCCLYYLDRSETAGDIHWAAGSTNGICFEDGTPAVSWTAYDNGIELELDYVAGMTFSCPNIVVVDIEETTPAEEEEETEPVEETEAETVADETVAEDVTVEDNTAAVEETTEAPKAEETTAAAVEETTEAPKAEETTAAAAEATTAAAAEETTAEAKSGCGAVVGFGAVAVLAAAAAAVALKKKD